MTRIHCLGAFAFSLIGAPALGAPHLTIEASAPAIILQMEALPVSVRLTNDGDSAFRYANDLILGASTPAPGFRPRYLVGWFEVSSQAGASRRVYRTRYDPEQREGAEGKLSLNVGEHITREVTLSFDWERMRDPHLFEDVGNYMIQLHFDNGERVFSSAPFRVSVVAPPTSEQQAFAILQSLDEKSLRAVYEPSLLFPQQPLSVRLADLANTPSEVYGPYVKLALVEYHISRADIARVAPDRYDRVSELDAARRLLRDVGEHARSRPSVASRMHRLEELIAEPSE